MKALMMLRAHLALMASIKNSGWESRVIVLDENHRHFAIDPASGEADLVVLPDHEEAELMTIMGPLRSLNIELKAQEEMKLVEILKPHSNGPQFKRGKGSKFHGDNYR